VGRAVINRGLFTSAEQTWRTPRAVYEALDAEFGFDFDPCPSDPDFDGLAAEWGRSNFVNPPYNGIKAWAAKGYAEAQKGKGVVFLIPSRTDTAWWHDVMMCADEIRFLRGRLKFNDGKGSAPFPSAIVVFKRSGP
jgi:phage N-6-adenine-methyltransferase